MNPQDTVYITTPINENPATSGWQYTMNKNMEIITSMYYWNGQKWPSDHIAYWLKPVKLSEITNSQPVKTNEDILVKALEECDEYLSQHYFEKGKPVYLNNIGANSILHKKMQQALSSYRTSLQGLSGKEIGHYEYD